MLRNVWPQRSGSPKRSARRACSLASYFLRVRFDLDLGAQSDRVNNLVAGVTGDAQLERQQRRGRVRDHFGTFDREDEFRHARTRDRLRRGAFSAVKNAPISRHTSVPPESPRQWVRISPTSL